jgi:mycofactocin system creatininase family protein
MTGLTWTEMASANGRCLLVVPVGSFEQHGPHLPLDTDTRIASALAEGLAAVPRVVIAPPLGYGASGEHAGFPGTISIGTEVLTDVLVEMVRSARASCTGVVFVCAHGGNTEGLVRATQRCESEGDRVFVWTPRVSGGDAHAGRTETSLMLAVAPETVRMGSIECGRTEPIDALWPELRRGGVRAVSPNGVLGDPTLASAEEGRALVESLRAELRAAVATWWEEVRGTTRVGVT